MAKEMVEEGCSGKRDGGGSPKGGKRGGQGRVVRGW